MEGIVTDGLEDRRRALRYTTEEGHGVVSVRVRPGHAAMLIDVSSGGALIETKHRLLPGTSVELVLERNHYRAGVRGRVLRCAVVMLHPSAVCYRGAIGFDRYLPWFVEPEPMDQSQQVV